MFGRIKKYPKVAVFTVVSTIVIIGFFVAKPFKKTEKIVYSFEKVDKGDVVKTVSTSGKLEIQGSYYIHSEISGVVTEVNVEINQKVKEGDLLAYIDSPSTVEDFERYKDTYKFAEIDMRDARELYRTKEELYREELISKKELDDAKLAYERAFSNYKQIQQNYSYKSKSVESRYVKSPIDGIVLVKKIALRDTVGSGNLLFEIVPSLDTMRLIVNVDESDVGYVKPGMNVDFTVSAYPDEVFRGIIDQLNMTPVLIDGITMYQTVVNCTNSESKLRPGMNATATIKSGHVKNVLRVPNQAFYTTPVGVEVEDKAKVVWKRKGIANDQFDKIPLELGLVGDSYAEVKSGELLENDEILVGITRERK